jgi:hypothetical protein
VIQHAVVAVYELICVLRQPQPQPASLCLILAEHRGRRDTEIHTILLQRAIDILQNLSPNRILIPAMVSEVKLFSFFFVDGLELRFEDGEFILF